MIRNRQDPVLSPFSFKSKKKKKGGGDRGRDRPDDQKCRSVQEVFWCFCRGSTVTGVFISLESRGYLQLRTDTLAGFHVTFHFMIFTEHSFLSVIITKFHVLKLWIYFYLILFLIPLDKRRQHKLLIPLVKPLDSLSVYKKH